MHEINPIEILEGIFYFYPDESFENDREVIHSSFYELRNKYSEKLKYLTFILNFFIFYPYTMNDSSKKRENDET